MARWRKSSYSNDHQGACIELAGLGGGLVGVRDSKAPGAGHFTLPVAELALLMGRVRNETLGVASN
ncbi:DUF397 domain-containing protein [Actinomadura oligospora]|uniref:DUF397 domain-containing protein n=1 Tax=Actinomadura oligospora TaxID=111804 RepID=UPI000557E2B0|nr:DUF397 domain-containing protein [Actinomadura oligospora]